MRIKLVTGVLIILAFAVCSYSHRVENYAPAGFDESNQIDASSHLNSEKINFQAKDVNVEENDEVKHHRNHKHKHRPRVGHRQLMQNGMQQMPNGGYANGGSNKNGGYANGGSNNNGGSPRSIRQQRIVNLPDNWDKIPYIMQTYNKPEQSYLMPALSNGFIGTTAFNDSLYVNGLHNGVQEKSHRLRVPSLVAVEAYFPLTDDEDIIQYHFNCRHGLFTIKTRDNQAEITQHYYVHRRFKNLIVNEIRVELLRGVPVIIELYNETKLHLNMAYVNQPSNPNGYSYYFQDQNPENVSFEQRVIKHPTYLSNRRTELNDGIYHLAATIPQTEIPNKRQKQIHTFYTNVPPRITVYANRTFQTFHFLQTVDSDSFRARGAYEDALRMIQQDPNSLFVSHTTAWEEVWQKNGLAAVHETSYSDQNLEIFKLSQRMYASFYNLYASLPFTFDSQFYGLSPAGLAYGGLRAEYLNNSMIPNNRQLAEGYGGHVMYHQELFILPLVSMFSQDMSRSIINSRLRRGLNTDHMNMYEQARELAKQEGFVGVKYPWEQADYGVDVSPFADARKSKLHVSADISFGIRSYLRATHSREFLQQSISSDVSIRGEEYLNEIAKYWSDRFEMEPTTNQYEIKRVSFGERSQPNEVNNEAFTNYIGTMAMSAYKYAIYLSDRNPYDPQYEVTVREYDDKMNRARIPYDTFRQLYLEYDNFNSQQHEETWAPFLNFPLQKDITYAQKKILYDNYASRLPSDGRNMQSFASFLVGYLELNEDAKARDYLNRMYPYFAGSFLVATEFPQTTSAINPQNTFNYLPSYAAFATAFIAGYCGVRYRDFQLDLVYPSEFFNQYQAQGSSQYPVFTQPAPNVEVWNVTGLLYRGNKLDIIYSLRAKSVEIRNRRPSDQFIIPDDTLEIAIYEGTERVVKPLRVGDSVMISLTTESWIYAPKKSRLQKKNSYSDNMHILASIYSTQMNRYVVRPNSSPKMAASFSSFFYICILSISLLFTAY